MTKLKLLWAGLTAAFVAASDTAIMAGIAEEDHTFAGLCGGVVACVAVVIVCVGLLLAAWSET